MMPIDTNKALRLYEVAPETYIMPGGFYRGSFALIMSEAFLARLSDEDREAVLSTTGERLTTGVAVVGVAGEDGPLGATVNSLTAVSLDPMLLLFFARNGSRTAARIRETGAFSVNILTADQETVSRHYAGAQDEDIDWAWHAFGDTIQLEGANAVFLCRLRDVHPAGDHIILVGLVTDMGGPENPSTPLLYHGGRYATFPWPGQTPEPASAVDFWWTG